MDLGLKGKKALVTGGTRGIGCAIVDVLVAEGCDVSFCARDAKQVKEKVKSMKSLGPAIYGSVCDVSDPKALLKWIKDSHNMLGGIDIYIPNVSGGALSGEEGWKSAFDVDLMSSVRGSEAALAMMGEGGSIVMISSIAGLEASGAQGPYNTMKVALTSYASQLGEVAATKGVRVNSVSPGPIYVEDGFWGNVERTAPDFYNSVAERHPFGRLGSTKEVAISVAFLASPVASWITRTNHIVDGGFLKRIQY